jgi:poly(3-hydroxybutyrate) depolymerase
MPAEYYLDTIKTVFQDFALVNGTWQVGGDLVRPQDITGTALLTVEGELDDISGAGQTKAAHELCSGIDSKNQFHYDAIGAGLHGIFSGRRWREKVYPVIQGFIAKYDAAPLHKPVAAKRATASRPAAARKPRKPTE